MAFGVLVLFEAWLGPRIGPGPAEPWGRRYVDGERVLGVLGIVLVARVAEQLIFRGALFTQLASTRIRTGGAVLVTAIERLGLWSAT